MEHSHGVSTTSTAEASRRCGVPQSLLRSQALYKLLDTSNIGFVREDRFIKTMKNSRILTAEEGKDAFLHLDIDYDDKLTMRELLIGVNNAFNV